jgi:hypothetical protein
MARAGRSRRSSAELAWRVARSTPPCRLRPVPCGLPSSARHTRVRHGIQAASARAAPGSALNCVLQTRCRRLRSPCLWRFEPGAPIKKSAGSRRSPQIESSVCGVVRGSAARENRGQPPVQRALAIPGSSPRCRADPPAAELDKRGRGGLAGAASVWGSVGSYGRIRRKGAAADRWRRVARPSAVHRRRTSQRPLPLECSGERREEEGTISVAVGGGANVSCRTEAASSLLPSQLPSPDGGQSDTSRRPDVVRDRSLGLPPIRLRYRTHCRRWAPGRVVSRA